MKDKRLKEQLDWLDRYVLNPNQSEAMIKMKLKKLEEQKKFRALMEQIRRNQK